MRFPFGLGKAWSALPAGAALAAWLALGTPAAPGQTEAPRPRGSVLLAAACPSPYASPASSPVGCPAPFLPGPPTAPTPAPTFTPPSPPTPGGDGAAPPPEAPSALASTFGAEGASVVGGGYFSGTGYIDSAIPITQFRLRFDAAYDDNRPDRADFFYPKCGCFGNGAPGPGNASTGGARRVDYQELSSYFEFAPTQRLSGFVEVPFRWVDIAFLPAGVANENHHDLSDVNFGLKYALLYEPDRVVTVQLRTYAPTGDSTRGLGRNNWNVEPALLVYQRLSERLIFEGEVRDFIPISSADDFAGNVIRYGAGLSYLVYTGATFRVAPVGELVGWTALSGKELADAGPVNAAGDTIVNAKVGLRLGFGQATEPGVLSKADLYIGYGRALTGDVWYKDIFRAELRYRF
jgi:hypothetical protein